MSRPVFIVPHYSTTEQSWIFLRRALGSLVAQSDPDWEAVVVDDASPSARKAERLESARGLDPARIHIVQRRENEGPGAARNVGVAWAAGRGAPFVLFQDADDLADPDRLRAARDCFTRPDVDFVYSTFVVVDELDRPVAQQDLTPSVREILRGHASQPIDGRDQWLRVALEKGYTTPTPTVAVRTRLASAHPFPTTFVSEDSHTWLRMLAGGTTVAFLDRALARRRICSHVQGSMTRQRFGDAFYWMKLQVDLDGLNCAMQIAREAGTIGEEDERTIRQRFHLRQARTMESEGKTLAAAVCRGLAQLSRTEPADVPARVEIGQPYAKDRRAARRVVVGRG